MFEKLLQLVYASNKYGFALVFMGVVLFLNQVFGFFPFHLSDAIAEWVVVATLLGAGMLAASLSRRSIPLAARVGEDSAVGGKQER